MNTKLDISYADLHRDYVENCIAVKALAKKYGCSDVTIWNRLRKYEIELRPRGLNLPDSIISEYVVDGKTLETIASEHNCNSVSVWEFLKKRGVQCRPRAGHFKGVPRTAEAKMNISNALKGKPKSPDQQERLRSHGFKGFHHSDESKKMISCKTSGRKFTPEHCQKISKSVSGERHGNWRGGITSHKYCEKFNNKLKESIRNEHNRTCVLCNKPENGKLLDVHHINFDKMAGCYGRRWNLVPLHRSCHAWTTCHRFESFHLLMNHWAMNTEINFGACYDIYPYYVERNVNDKRGKNHRAK